MVKLEIQYFRGCPNTGELLDNLGEVVDRRGELVEMAEILVEDPETAKRVGFRGSPTLLIDGEDFERRPVPESPNLSCRLYPEGLPTVDEIITRIEQA